MTDRSYVARVELRADSNVYDLTAVSEAIEASGYQVEYKHTKGVLEVYRP